MRRLPLTAETFLAALAVLSTGCSKRTEPSQSAPPVTAEPPSPPATATAAPVAATAEPGTPKEETDKPATNASAAPAPPEPPPPRNAQNAASPKPVATTTVMAPPKNAPAATVSAGCGANGCSPDMKKGHLKATPTKEPK
jgi:hypothetical protein